jgi:hypothetical protein
MPFSDSVILSFLKTMRCVMSHNCTTFCTCILTRVCARPRCCATQVLLDAANTCKVSDFGMSSALGGEDSDCECHKLLFGFALFAALETVALTIDSLCGGEPEIPSIFLLMQLWLVVLVGTAYIRTNPQQPIWCTLNALYHRLAGRECNLDKCVR